MSEKIAYVDNEHLDSLLGTETAEGFFGPTDQWRAILKNFTSYGERDPLEDDSSKKQLVAYCVIRHEDELFAYRRGGDIKEDRLQDNWSVGWGGHIESQDDDNPRMGLWRELDEELDIDSSTVADETFEGFILDSGFDAVGAVHIGLAYVVELDSKDVEVQEEQKHPVAEWQTVEKLWDASEHMENWSRIFLSQIDSESPKFNDAAR